MSFYKSLDSYEPAARVVDKGAVLILGATLLEWVPHAAAIITLLWMVIRLLNEWHTWRHRNDANRNRRKSD